ncbi:AMP-binding protein [Pseudomonas kilonensis]|uniref:Amino acid adenylation domain-containing protein n=1 Tax=Pseudomonas kilonensis TaxID=132476 RepID=A0ABY0ZB59_9PSED|nr:AMP-binding protein [Pseudomonas kilonensis]SEE49585.1 amino acid adenylation domain-containing protein [Pseudomonas kilonensis]
MSQAVPHDSILDLVLGHCYSSPDTAAIVVGDSVVTYQELRDKIYKVSTYIQGRGVEVGSVIAIMQNNIGDALASMLGCLHAGCIYCPIDASLPPAKIQRTLAVANVEFVLSEQDLPYIWQSDDPEFVHYKELPIPASYAALTQRYHPLAYIMFTSGSTGDPKGVAIGHANLIEIFRGWDEIYQLKKLKRHLQFASLSFDVFAGDWLRGLCSGAIIYVPTSAEKYVVENLAEFIITYQIECAEFTPIILRELYGYALRNNVKLSSFKLLIAGSDVMRVREFKDVRKIISDDCRLVFSYGTTETTIDSTYFEATHEALSKLQNDAPLPIGVPFPCTLITILKDDGTHTDLHEVGELYIGGGGVGQGYLHHDVRTSGRYLRRLPLGRHARWYRTGDLASYDGQNFNLHGRADARIKVHGKLIDLTELEAHLRAHEDILECVATTTRHDLNKKILLLVKLKPTSARLKREAIAEHVSNLEDYPVSSNDIYFTKDLPVTMSGKIDRVEANRIAITLQAGVAK